MSSCVKSEIDNILKSLDVARRVSQDVAILLPMSRHELKRYRLLLWERLKSLKAKHGIPVSIHHDNKRAN